jgi:hypothetical protein
MIVHEMLFLMSAMMPVCASVGANNHVDRNAQEK